MTDAERLRSYLGEVIPTGGADIDTMFTNAEIDDILTFKGTSPNVAANLYMAASEGWGRKAAQFANLVTTQEGGSSRNSSDLYEHAKSEENRFLSMAMGRDRTRIGKIVRPGTTIR